MYSREEAEELMAQGSDAVFAVLEDMGQQVSQLESKVKELQALTQDSSNTSVSDNLPIKNHSSWTSRITTIVILAILTIWFITAPSLEPIVAIFAIIFTFLDVNLGKWWDKFLALLIIVIPALAIYGVLYFTNDPILRKIGLGPTQTPPTQTHTPIPPTLTPTSTPCTIRTEGRYIYKVVEGDDWVALAESTGSTVGELQEINCYYGELFVGKDLYLPVELKTPTPSLTPPIPSATPTLTHTVTPVFITIIPPLPSITPTPPSQIITLTPSVTPTHTPTHTPTEVSSS